VAILKVMAYLSLCE